MIELKRISSNGNVTTIYRHEKLKTVELYLELVVTNNEGFKNVKAVTFIDGCKGVSAESVYSGKVTMYKIVEPLENKLNKLLKGRIGKNDVIMCDSFFHSAKKIKEILKACKGLTLNISVKDDELIFKHDQGYLKLKEVPLNGGRVLGSVWV